MLTCVLLRMHRYVEFKAALEGLDPKRQSVSPLPIIYQWQQPMGGPGTKCAPAERAGGSLACNLRQQVCCAVCMDTMQANSRHACTGSDELWAMLRWC